MLFGVVPGLGAHVENGAIVENEYCESQRKLGHGQSPPWTHSIESTVERGQQFLSQATHSFFQGSAAVCVAGVRPGVGDQEDSKTLNMNLNGNLKILGIEKLKLSLPSLDRKSLTFFPCSGC